MADIAARREARRRKILENSESRLQRISGQTNNARTIDNHNKKCEKSDLDGLLNNLNSNGIFPRESLVNSSWDDPIEIENEIIQADLLQSNVLHQRRNLNTNHENVCNDNGIINNQDYQSRHDTADECRNVSSNSSNQKLNNPSEIINNEKINEESMLNNVFLNRFVYLILAASLNFLLILRMENKFGTSIIIPFFLIFSTRLWIIGQMTANKRSESSFFMIIAALILCNIRPSVIHTLRKIINFTNLLFTDFAIFLFDFVFIFYFITQYWIDIDVTSDKKVEIIVNRRETT